MENYKERDKFKYMLYCCDFVCMQEKQQLGNEREKKK